MNSAAITGDTMLAVAATCLIAFTAGYISTDAGKKALEVSSRLRFPPVHLFGLWMTGLVVVALTTKFSSPSCLRFLEGCSAFFLSMASVSLVSILLHEHHFSWINYVPLAVLFFLFSFKLARILGLDHLTLKVLAALSLAKARLLMFWKNFKQRLGGRTNLENQPPNVVRTAIV